MTGKWTKTTFVIIAFFVLLLLSYDYRMKLDRHIEAYDTSNTLIRDSKDISLMIKNNIKESVLYQYYNNDAIYSNIKALEAKLQQIELRITAGDLHYKRTEQRFAAIRHLLKEKFELIDELVSKNSKIKNSLSYLATLSSRVDHNDHRYYDDVIKAVNYFFHLKNSMDLAGLEDRSRYTALLSYRFEDPQSNLQHMLIVNHAALIIKEFPAYIDVFNALVELDDIKAFDDLLAAYLEESQEEHQSINIQLYVIVFFSVLTLAVIIYFIFYTEKEKQVLAELQEAFRRSVTTERLTNLKNRIAFFQDRDKLKQPQAVLIDLIDFSHINTLLGTEGGDVVLQKIADKLKNIDPQSRYKGLYKVGVDEFAFLFDKKSKEHLEKFAAAVIETVETSLIEYKGIKVPINIHIGVSESMPLLLKAQTCIKELKRSYGQKVLFYSDELDQSESTRKNIEMIHTIKKAIETDGVKPLYQPIVDLKTKEIIKHEALVRIEDKGNYIAPLFFLDISKKIKLYNKITQIVLTKSMQRVIENEMAVSINISVEDVKDRLTQEFILQIIHENPDHAHLLSFEIVESEKIEDKSMMLDFIGEIKRLGCGVVIDDFGSGYSNFDYLLQFHADHIKIDGSLIKELDKNENNRLIVKTIVDFAAQTGMKTVAEFVHNETIDKIVTEMGIDYGQGYYYSEPVEL